MAELYLSRGRSSANIEKFSATTIMRRTPSRHSPPTEGVTKCRRHTSVSCLESIWTTRLPFVSYFIWLYSPPYCLLLLSMKGHCTSVIQEKISGHRLKGFCKTRTTHRKPFVHQFCQKEIALLPKLQIIFLR